MCCKQLTGLAVADRWPSAAGVRRGWRGRAAGGRGLVAWDAAAVRDWEWERQRELTGARHGCCTPAAVAAVVVAAMAASLKTTTHAVRVVSRFISDVFIMQNLSLMDRVYFLNTRKVSLKSKYDNGQ